VHRVAVILFLGASACRPAARPAPLAPDEPEAGAGVADTPTTAEPDAPPPSDDDVGPSAETVCAAYAKAYCEPGDASPDAIRPEQRDFIALDCQKALLQTPDAAAETMGCVERTKDCAAMRACLPKVPP
jgi:hypothetical protein